MQDAPAKVLVLGAGSWGTAVAIHLAGRGMDTVLWGHDRKAVERLARERQNGCYLPSVVFPERLQLDADLPQAAAGARLIVVAVPSHAFRETLVQVRPCVRDVDLVWLTKGLEQRTGKFLHTVVEETFGDAVVSAVLSGPSFAAEVAAGVPTAVSLAAASLEESVRIARFFHSDRFRVYACNDVVGVELAGASKNVFAIAAGIADGLGYGANTRAALITRSLAEMTRLGRAVGGRMETFMGLSGVGDLILTCTDNQSRNRRLGLALGRGEALQNAVAAIGQVVEGVNTAAEIRALARRHGVEMPIVEQVCAVLFDGKTPRQAVDDLLSRDPRPEYF